MADALQDAKDALADAKAADQSGRGPWLCRYGSPNCLMVDHCFESFFCVPMQKATLGCLLHYDTPR